MGAPLERMLAGLDAHIQQAYVDSAAAAMTDPQQAGHVAEATWMGVLGEWLPTGYSVEARRYVTPETNQDEFETDLLVFRPIVPGVVRKQTRVPHGAIAAAFFVRRTADRAGLRDAVDRASRLRRSMDRSNLDNDAQAVHPAYPIGFLSLSHSWSSPTEAAAENVTKILLELDKEVAQQPAESLDLCCIADLGSWSRRRFPHLPEISVRHLTGDESAPGGCPISVLQEPSGRNGTKVPHNPVGQFVRELYGALELTDPQLTEFAYSLRKQVPWTDDSSRVRLWR
jgi:hypothetical protein